MSPVPYNLTEPETRLIKLQRTGLTRSQAAHRLRVSVSHFCRWLRGEKTSQPLTVKFEKLYTKRTQRRIASHD